MDLEKIEFAMDPSSLSFVESEYAGKTNSGTEPKSAQRIRYESEVIAIKKRYGSLDEMREKLELSRRRMCEYLLVDPSAWTRWTSLNEEESAPAHVYKTMGLFMEKLEKDPLAFRSPTTAGLDDMRRLEFSFRQEIRDSESEIKADVENKVKNILEDYSADMEKRVLLHIDKIKSLSLTGAELSLGWKILILLNVIFIGFALFR